MVMEGEELVNQALEVREGDVLPLHEHQQIGWD
jgi:hypothetical protein